jgi:hypothetical protein
LIHFERERLKSAGFRRAATNTTGDAMLSLQEISDRLEIQDLLTRYCYAIDEKNFDDLDNVFTPDATIDYSQVGGETGSYEKIKAYLPSALGDFQYYNHAISTTRLRINGDTAEAHSILFNPMMPKGARGQERFFFVGLHYHDHLVRTPQGWRIKTRIEEKPYFYPKEYDASEN